MTWCQLRLCPSTVSGDRSIDLVRVFFCSEHGEEGGEVEAATIIAGALSAPVEVCGEYLLGKKKRVFSFFNNPRTRTK